MSNDGGPAFPSSVNPLLSVDDCGKITPLMSNGMSLRDYFAGQALIGILSGPKDELGIFTVEERAYMRADAMLTERAKAEGNQP